MREAIEQRNWKEADEQIEVIAGAVTGYAELLKRAAVQLEGLAP